MLNFPDSAQLIIIEAPSGYGKTFYIENVLPENQKKIKISPFNSFNFFESLKSQCLENDLQYPLTEDYYQWYESWKNTEKFIFILDDFHILKNNQQINHFIQYILKNNPKNIQIVITSREKINLDFQDYFATGKAVYIDRDKLKFSFKDFEKLLLSVNLKAISEDKDFYNYCDGWNKAILLYLQLRKSEIPQEFFQQLIESSVKDIFFVDNKFSIGCFLFFFHAKISKLFNDIALKVLQDKSEYWYFISKDKNLRPEEKQVYLERALGIAFSDRNIFNTLNYSTRLAHQYSLSADFIKLDATLNSTEMIIEKGRNVDKIAWLYMKANRLRQQCLHEEAKILLYRLFNVFTNDESGFNLQTKANVLMGLTEYQLGNYQETREYYNKALLLAKGENNNSLNLEITIMLAFLDRWEGKVSSILPKNVIQQIEEQPLPSQPIMFLNLAFYWLLGEDVDIELTSSIIEKIKAISKQLKYKFLIPLIADVEARIMRFKREYDKAIECHNIVLSHLEKDSFEYLHGYLNFALTLLRQGKKEDAKNILNHLLEQAKDKGTKGIEREIKVLLQEITPNSALNMPFLTTIKRDDENTISIKMFGGFQVKIGERMIAKWARKKARHLLIHLLLNPRGIHRETLAELIFSSEELDNPLQNLDVNIHNLRKVLEPDRKTKESSFILFQDSCYIFNWSHSHTFDLVDFENLYKEWQKEKDEKTKISISEAIINIYDGLFLPEIDFADNWYEEREDLQRKAHNIFNFIIPILIKNRDERAEYFVSKMINTDNLNENAYLYMFEVSKNKKDKELLKTTYNKALKIFKKELDDTPSDEFIATYKKAEKLLKNL